MTTLPRTALALGVTALSLAVAASPAAAKDKAPKLQHTHLTVKSTHEKVSGNNSFKATVVARLRAKQMGLAAEPVELFQRVKGGASKWVDTGAGATTDATGAASFAFVQSDTKGQYRVVFAGDSTYDGSHSGTITINKLQASATGS
jgi:hypothetical protein